MENGKKTLYVQVMKAIYGMLQAALLWYKKFRKDLEEHGFKFNKYDPCVANKMVRGKQQTIRFHVDNLMSSHEDKQVNDEFEKWLQNKYGKFGAVKAHRGKSHEYLGMKFSYEKDGTVNIDMMDYVTEILEEFPEKLKSTDTAITPASETLWSKGQFKALDGKRKDIFHSMVAKCLFVAKRARADIHPTVAVFCTRVKEPHKGDWLKLRRLMRYLNGTRTMTWKIRGDDLKCIKWMVDAAFAVHPYFKSHTGATMSYGGDSRGAIQTISRKQKLNTRSSTEAELVAVDDVITSILWTKLFMEEQGYNVEKNILYQDNRSVILLETNGKKSAGKRSRALNIRYFFIADQVEKKQISVEYCSTDAMIGDFMMKPLQGIKFHNFRSAIMGH